ncbi:MAG: ATP synthase F1 subunit epsilon [Eubacteriales bacterium]
MADNRETFEVEIITPDEVFYEASIDFIEFTTVEGEVGIYKNHIPMTTILEPCVMRLYHAGEMQKCAILGGFVEIQKEKITVLAEDAQWPNAIDLPRAQEAAKRAQERLANKVPEMDVMRAEVSLKRAVARINAVD